MTQNPLAEKSDVGKVVVVFMFLVEFGGWYGRGRHIKTRIPSQLWQLRMVLKKKKIKRQNETKANTGTCTWNMNLSSAIFKIASQSIDQFILSRDFDLFRILYYANILWCMISKHVKLAQLKNTQKKIIYWTLNHYCNSN